MTRIHLFFLFGAIPAIAYADILGLLWIRGVKQTLDRTTLYRLHIWICACLAGIIATGVLMFLGQSSYFLGKPTFIIKMIFVATLLLNSLLIDGHVKQAETKPYADLSHSERHWILASGFISAIAWPGAIIGGLLIGE